MIPPICAVCCARGRDAKCSLVRFADDATNAMSYSCIGLKWFCKAHIKRARELTEYNEKDAIAIMKKEFCL